MVRGNLVKNSIGLMVAVIVIVAVAIPVIQDSLVLDTNSVVNETEASAGAVPETLAVDTLEAGLVEDSDVIYLNDSFDDTIYKLERGTDYEVLTYEDSPQFNVTTADLDSDGTDEINSTNDLYKLNYDYKPEGYIDNAAARTILNFLPLILALGVFISAISLVKN